MGQPMPMQPIHGTVVSATPTAVEPQGSSMGMASASQQPQPPQPPQHNDPYEYKGV